MSELSVRAFYDDLADDYHPMFRDWDASMAYQAEVLDGLLSRCLGEGRTRSWTARAGSAPRRSGRPRRGTGSSAAT